MLLHVAGLAEKLQHTLVSAKHNSGAGYNAEHVGHETTVERGHALLFPDELETLRQACVLETTVLLRGLSQSCSDDLMGVCDECGDELSIGKEKPLKF